MKTPIYELLLYSRPQALADLDHYQRRWFDRNIAVPEKSAELPVRFEYAGEGIEEIQREMAKAPSRSRGNG